MKITVGGRELITTAVLQVPDGEDAWIEFQAGTWNVRLNVKFVDDKEDSTQRFFLEGKDDHAVLTFNNWNNGLPSAIPKPFPFGETDNRKIAFVFSGYSVAGFKRLDISFLWETENGQ
ncbi:MULTISPECIES: DUF6864 domain-containing function [Acidovorax]|uniref:DUF6864 domain-containing function n=1 Tax=Acidovorax facilis TaxID=12917 RepID=A0ABV8DF47_9BURK|nr:MULTISPECIES: hypothetical protein [Acidovorax]KQB56821.1 hypothetical protein AE621_24070 [Acidovorax sp. SD340]KRD46545.1 hypothetical protein ASE52_18030 [Acidovorax sp. Root275]MBO1010697.1 hypothetical protein [Acidovorax sp. SD340]MCO4244710.1 hypothetical protein [Acidovorax facilis]RKR66663.1 hypothetical protein C8C94_1123 [Acidovorax sp. 94]